MYWDTCNTTHPLLEYLLGDHLHTGSTVVLGHLLQTIVVLIFQTEVKPEVNVDKDNKKTQIEYVLKMTKMSV